jgi:hypothetical protein
VTDRLRWMLLTHDGRTALAYIYLALGAVSVITYAIYRSPLYALAQGVLIVGSLLWVRWCIRRR